MKETLLSKAKVRLLNQKIREGFRVYNVGNRKPFVFWLDIYIHPWFPHLVFVKDKTEEDD